MERQPLKKPKLGPKGMADLLQNRRLIGESSGQQVTRIAVAYEAGRDRFWLTRLRKVQGIESSTRQPATQLLGAEHTIAGITQARYNIAVLV